MCNERLYNYITQRTPLQNILSLRLAIAGLINFRGHMNNIELIKKLAGKYKKRSESIDVPIEDDVISLDDELICKDEDNIKLDGVVYSE